jgi:hypothetical protein
LDNVALKPVSRIASFWVSGFGCIGCFYEAAYGVVSDILGSPSLSSFFAQLVLYLQSANTSSSSLQYSYRTVIILQEEDDSTWVGHDWLKGWGCHGKVKELCIHSAIVHCSALGIPFSPHILATCAFWAARLCER